MSDQALDEFECNGLALLCHELFGRRANRDMLFGQQAGDVAFARRREARKEFAFRQIKRRIDQVGKL